MLEQLNIDESLRKVLLEIKKDDEAMYNLCVEKITRIENAKRTGDRQLWEKIKHEEERNLQMLRVYLEKQKQKNT